MFSSGFYAVWESRDSRENVLEGVEGGRVGLGVGGILDLESRVVCAF